jgi:hypothetical protein
MVSSENLLQQYLPLIDKTKEVMKYKYIRDAECKSAEEVFNSRRLPSFPIFDDKLFASWVSDTYLDDYLMVGLSD